MIVVDTSFLVDFFRGEISTKDYSDNEFVTTTVTFYEIMTGIRRKKAKKEKQYFSRFFGEVALLAFDRKAADYSSDISANMFSIGKIVNALDIMITGIALANGIYNIITRDKDFLEIEKVCDIEIIQY
ncbi:MAG: PIN domain-containing protein [Candidatus Lokiarchaeota archaeon]|nr:PIN domain-containing protein [Candidatus Lokiarchaeota archaeon]